MIIIFFFEKFELKVALANNFVNNDIIKISTLFKKFVFDSLFNENLYAFNNINVKMIYYIN